jgi:predicted unusual protein kinase regulating ubiquinone biosynthesis (AarF/ABC1/UbiB family)
MIRTRYRKITSFFARVIASVILWEILFPKIGLRRWSARTRPERLRKMGAAYRRLAVHLGGVMIKGGQFLSARIDILPPEITEELAGLQDEVPPVDFGEIRQLAEAEFGATLEEVYQEFDPTPLAAASLGQVHRAILKPPDSDGNLEIEAIPFNRVVVKVQRPGIEDVVATDIAALETVGNWVKRYPPIRRRVDVRALLREFTRVTYEEIDYVSEANNAATFGKNFNNRVGIRIPQVVWTHSTKRVLTLEDVYAIKITDFAAIEAAGIDREAVAERLYNAYMQQLFQDRIVHADPHPGNLFVEPLLKSENGTLSWTLTFVDFGMVARVTPGVLSGIRDLAIGLATQDPKRVISAYQKMGILLPSADLSLLEQIEEKMFAHVWGKNMSELREVSHEDIQELADDVREVLYDLPFQVPQDLIFLGRTIAILQGMCTGLNPKFNVWESLSPYARVFLAEESNLGTAEILENAIDQLRLLLALPGRINRILTRLERNELEVRNRELTRQVRTLTRSVNRLGNVIIFVGTLLGSIQLYLAGEFILAAILMSGSGLSLLSILFARRSRR